MARPRLLLVSLLALLLLGQSAVAAAHWKMPSGIDAIASMMASASTSVPPTM